MKKILLLVISIIFLLGTSYGYYYVVEGKCYGDTNPNVYVSLKQYKGQRCIFLNSCVAIGSLSYVFPEIVFIPETDRKNYTILKAYDRQYISVARMGTKLIQPNAYNFYAVPIINAKPEIFLNKYNFIYNKYGLLQTPVSKLRYIGDIEVADVKNRKVFEYYLGKIKKSNKSIFLAPEKRVFISMVVKKILRKLDKIHSLEGKKRYLSKLLKRIEAGKNKIREYLQNTPVTIEQVNNYLMLGYLDYIFPDVEKYIKELINRTEKLQDRQDVPKNKSGLGSRAIIKNHKTTIDYIIEIKHYLSTSSYSKFDKTLLKAQQNILDRFLKETKQNDNKKRVIKGEATLTGNIGYKPINYNLKINNLSINSYNQKYSVDGNVKLNGDLNIETIFKAIIDSDYLFVNFKKFLLNGEEPYKKYYGEYIRHKLQKDNISINEIKNIFKTEPLFREIPGKLIGKDKNVIVPTENFVKIFNLIKGRHTNYDDVLKSYMRLIKTDRYFYYIYKNYKYTLFLGNSYFLNTIVVQDNGDLDKITFVNVPIVLSFTTDTITLSYNDEKVVEYVSNTTKTTLKVSGNIDNFDVNANVYYNKQNGNTKIDTIVKISNSPFFGVVKLRGAGILKEGKNDFSLNGEVGIPAIGKFKINLTLKDTSYGYNSYKEKFLLKLSGDYNLMLNYDFVVKNGYSVPVYVPTNFIDEEQVQQSLLMPYQARAYDTARKANLSQISTALEIYFNDHGEYPKSGNLYSALVPVYIYRLPIDPQTRKKYFYMSIYKNGADGGGAILGAKMSDPKNCNVPFTSEEEIKNWIKENDYEESYLDDKLKNFEKNTFKPGCYYVRFN